VRAADVLVINKVNAVESEAVRACEDEARRLNVSAPIVRMASVGLVDRPDLVRGQRVLAVDDGPSLTHGGMSEGVAARAARDLDAELIDPRHGAVGEIREVFQRYPHIGTVLPAMGYGRQQLADLAETIRRTDCATVLLGTPAPIERFIDIRQATARVTFRAQDRDAKSLADVTLELLGG